MFSNPVSASAIQGYSPQTPDAAREIHMQIIVAGSGKLATELLDSLKANHAWRIVPWAERIDDSSRSIVVHAGSGRELQAIADYCAATHSSLIELATGSAIESSAHDFPVVMCPNTNILMLKFMNMLEQCGHLFQGHQIALTESHQATKTSVPGTAVNIAHSLGLKPEVITSIRNANTQEKELHIPKSELVRHAYHQVIIQDDACSIKLETRVYGESPYADGVSKIVAAVHTHNLENRPYQIAEFIAHGWI
jgi:4-hydroxy-tetrahydrodipicolinate reductase